LCRRASSDASEVGPYEEVAAPDSPLTVEPTDLAEEPPSARRNAITRMFEAVSPHPDWVLEFVIGLCMPTSHGQAPQVWVRFIPGRPQFEFDVERRHRARDSDHRIQVKL
jgi:hypothetical protein